ncbi:MAG: signal peptidase I [Clostridia bacterium]|nr:signal peptidase I [Clostridia bacterium]
MSNTTKKRFNPLSIIGILLCVVLAFLLVCNVIIIVKGSADTQKPPSVFGVTPMIVLSQSMSGDAPDHIEIDDLVFIDNSHPDTMEIGDVVSFMEGKIVVTHRIIDIKTNEDGSREFITGGDNNRDENGDVVLDTETVKEANVIGKYMFRIPKIGALIYFMQKPLGMIAFIGIPLFAFIIYDIIRRQRAATKDAKKNDEMQAELERLRALAGEGAKKEESPAAEETPAE